MLGNALADSLGMSMHNAVTTQMNAQTLNTASTTAACSRILNAFVNMPFERSKPLWGGGAGEYDTGETGETGETG